MNASIVILSVHVPAEVRRQAKARAAEAGLTLARYVELALASYQQPVRAEESARG